MYVVMYSEGQYEEYREIIVFVTKSKSKAEKYQARFNRIMRKWYDYYSQYETRSKWIADEHLQHFDRWFFLRELNDCFIKEVEER